MNRKTTERVAVKIFAKSRFLNKEASMAMFAREREIISSLNHVGLILSPLLRCVYVYLMSSSVVQPGIVNYRNFFEDELSLC